MDSKTGSASELDLSAMPLNGLWFGGGGMRRSRYLAIQRRSIHFFSHHQARDELA